MPSTDDPGAIDGLTYSGAEWRRMDVLGFAANGSAAAMATGIRPGDPGLAVTLAALVVNVSAGVAVLYHSGTGAYRASFPTAVSPGSLTAADPTNPRIDLVYLRVWDNAVDGTGLFKTDIVYLAGTPAVSPVAPSPGVLEIYIPLATVAVPKSGGGSPSVSSTIRPVLVAPGGIAPSATAPGIYAGQYRDTGVAGGTLQRYNGTAWQDLLAIAAGGQVNVGTSGSNAALAVLGALTTTALMSGRIPADTQNHFLVTMDGAHSWGSGAAATDTALARTGVGAMALTGSLAVSGGLSVAAGVGSRKTYVKPSDQSKASTTTLSADSFFATMALEANATYVVDGMLQLSGATNGSGDFKMTLSGPAGATGFFSSGGTTTTSPTTFEGTAIPLGSSRTVGTNGTTDMAAHMVATITTSATAGNLALTWAQSTSSATATILRGGSWLRLERVA
jgi:hypothetical protein